MFARFAPIWEVDVADGNDQIGAIRWQNGPHVDTNRPAEYRLLSCTFLNGQVLPQQAPQGERRAIRLGSARHYIERVYASNDSADVTPLQLDSYDSLRALPATDGGGSHSLFG